LELYYEFGGFVIRPRPNERCYAV